jgi:hypothetical protein
MIYSFYHHITRNLFISMNNCFHFFFKHHTAPTSQKSGRVQVWFFCWFFFLRKISADDYACGFCVWLASNFDTPRIFQSYLLEVDWQ